MPVVEETFDVAHQPSTSVTVTQQKRKNKKISQMTQSGETAEPVIVTFEDVTAASFRIKNGTRRTPCTVRIYELMNVSVYFSPGNPVLFAGVYHAFTIFVRYGAYELMNVSVYFFPGNPVLFAGVYHAFTIFVRYGAYELMNVSVYFFPGHFVLCAGVYRAFTVFIRYGAYELINVSVYFFPGHPILCAGVYHAFTVFVRYFYI